MKSPVLDCACAWDSTSGSICEGCRTSAGCAAAAPAGGLSMLPAPGLVCICERGTHRGGSSAPCSQPGSGWPKTSAFCSAPAAHESAVGQHPVERCEMLVPYRAGDDWRR